MPSEKRPDPRYEKMLSWLDCVLPDHDAPAPASSDASFRRYFRVFSPSLPKSSDQCGSAIVMDAPPAQEDCAPFVAIAAQLAAAGVRVPQLRAQDEQQGFLLLDDLGDETFLSALARQGEAGVGGAADAAYRRAIDELIKIQQADGRHLPAYDAALLARELNLFHDWYLGVHRQRLLNAAEQQAWELVCQRLMDCALRQTAGFVHRDYHSRNLMWADSGALGVLDFQDAVYGPQSYDLVSLLRDCYVRWPSQQVQNWLAYYREQAGLAGIVLPAAEQFQREFDYMGLQRHLKAVGIFARLNHRDGKANYLNDIPLTLGYIRDVSSGYPELDFLHNLAVECLA